MRHLARELVFLALAAGLTWWVLLRPPEPALSTARAAPGSTLALQLLAEEPYLPAPEPLRAPETPPAEPPAAASAPEPREEEPPAERAPAEAGTPEGDPAAEPRVPEPTPAPVEESPERSEPVPPEPEPEPEEHEPEEPVPEEHETAEPEAPEPSPSGPSQAASPRAPAALMQDATLLARARQELASETAKGFATVLLAAPEEQLAIARAFGEELVLVPRATLDPAATSPHWFRIARTGEVESVAGRPPLDGFRQYRDLFDYEYARLPAPLRELRRSVLSKSEVFLFAALVPLEEWALVVGRREEALRASGRPLEEVRRFVLRYVRRAQGGFDLAVEEIVFADGSRFLPGGEPPAKEPTGASPPP